MKNLKLKKFTLISIFLILYTGYSNSNSSIDVLKNEVDASVIALAGANSVLNKSIYSIHSNPANLSELNYKSAGFNISNGFEDAKYNFLTFGIPLNIKGIGEISHPYMAASIYMTDLGDLTYRKILDDGTIQQKTISAEKNMVFSISYAEKVYREKTYISKGLKSDFEHSFGLTLKFVNSKMLDKYSADTFAVDLGYKGSLTELGIDFGLSVLNTLGKIKYIRESNDLPTTLKTGIKYSRPTIMDQKVAIYTEFDRYLVDKYNSLRIGLEYLIEGKMSFGVGYRFLEENKGLGIGVGLFADRFKLNVATTFFDVYKYTSFSVSYNFGPGIETEAKESKSLKIFKEKRKKEEEKAKEKPKNYIIVF